jgi:hypothetical protein
MTPATGTAGLLFAYAFLALLVFVVLRRAPWPAAVKTAALAAAAGFVFLSAQSLPPLLGWPTGQDLPPKFRLVGAQVQQPDKRSGSDGVIHLWVTDAGELASLAPPRAFALPYSDALHSAVTGAAARLGQGTAQLGETVDPADPDHRAAAEAARPGPGSSPIVFSDMPNPMFPDN